MNRVIVIGGGVIGTACAHFLARSGWDVTILERGAYGRGSSHGNCGLICPSHVLPLAEPGAVREALRALLRRNAPFAIRPRADPALWAWLIRFARRCNTRDMLAAARAIQALLDSSIVLYPQIIAEEDLPCEWSQHGLLYAFQDRAAFASFDATERLLRESFHCPGRRLGPDELAAFEPALVPGLAGGWYFDHDAQLRPDRLLASWRARLEARGVTVREQTAATGFQGTSGRAASVQTKQGEVPGDAFVVAAGAWTPFLNRELGCRIPIQPGKGYSLTMPRPAVCPRVPLIFPETRVAVTPFASGYRLGSTMEFAGYDDSLPEPRLRLLIDGARPYLREPSAEPIQERWFGWRPMTYDSLPIISPSPRWSNVLIAAGHNMLGMSMAPATGKLVAELLGGQTPHLDPTPYRAHRFH